MRRSMVNIQSLTAEIRRGKKRKKEETAWKYIWSALLHRATIKKTQIWVISNTTRCILGCRVQDAIEIISIFNFHISQYTCSAVMHLKWGGNSLQRDYKMCLEIWSERILTRSLGVTEEPHDVLCQLKFCQLLYNCMRHSKWKGLQQVNYHKAHSRLQEMAQYITSC